MIMELKKYQVVSSAGIMENIEASFFEVKEDCTVIFYVGDVFSNREVAVFYRPISVIEKK
jgi:hypothetical protein